ncbi:hypothetical protein [Streptacidiphilus sp. PAMC 29251]
MSAPLTAPAAHDHDPAHAHGHLHADGHSHVAGSSHASGEVYGPSHQGSVMVDIGGDVGALVIHTPADLLGTEVELSPVDDGTVRTHVAVRERRGSGPVQYAAVFPSLTAGAYNIWHPAEDRHPVARVVVTGGDVTNFTWPA